MSMNEFNPGRSKPWNIYSSSNPGPTEADYVSKEGSWKSFGSSINAISFGFVATAILISMFLIMAIFEHLFRPNEAPLEESSGMESRQMHKLGTPEITQTSYASDFSVVMPGNMTKHIRVAAVIGINRCSYLHGIEWQLTCVMNDDDGSIKGKEMEIENEERELILGFAEKKRENEMKGARDFGLISDKDLPLTLGGHVAIGDSS
ncbi:Unknown protein [Striga hermonthica]|uniref:Uncharacterized protein n=1 Tax=Striga hermonthica TaxID=68872 RepID=A0A9N7R481_STRHE|nr:Unknown protein [Striga hermonthica]